jgi:hypothetical protein
MEESVTNEPPAVSAAASSAVARGITRVTGAGWLWPAVAFVAVLVVAMLAADVVLGPRALAWSAGPSDRVGVGAGILFGWAWALLALRNLGRGRAWASALLAPLPIALALTAAALTLRHVVSG